MIDLTYNKVLTRQQLYYVLETINLKFPAICDNYSRIINDWPL